METIKNILAYFGILFLGQVIYRLLTSFYQLPLQEAALSAGLLVVFACTIFTVIEFDLQ